MSPSFHSVPWCWGPGLALWAWAYPITLGRPVGQRRGRSERSRRGRTTAREGRWYGMTESRQISADCSRCFRKVEDSTVEIWIETREKTQITSSMAWFSGENVKCVNNLLTRFPIFPSTNCENEERLGFYFGKLGWIILFFD